ncbi:MAG: isoprenylcysteine carboxylmethyltransferase family protein [Vicinamibacterales bacterium]
MDPVRILARLRVPLGFASAAIVFWLAQPTAASLLIGGLIAALGEGLRIWASGHLNKSREVTASGPYRLFAHPLYVGSAIMGGGLAVASASIAVAAIVLLYLASTIGAAIRSEERFLRGKFGAAYDTYRRGGTQDPVAASRRFSLAQAKANREYRAAAGLVAAVLLLCLKAAYNGVFWRTAGTP